MYQWQLFQIVLAFIDEFYVYDVMLWPHQGRRSCAELYCFLLVSFHFPSESHDHCLFWLTDWSAWSHDQNNLPCSFQLDCLHQVILFIKKKQGYSLIRVFDTIIVESKCPYLIKNGNASGVNYSTFWGAKGVPFMDNYPQDRIILAMNAVCLLFILFSSSWINCFNPLY